MKEIMEIDGIEDKQIDNTALHRNEITHEIEGTKEMQLYDFKRRKKIKANEATETEIMSDLKKTLIGTSTIATIQEKRGKR